MAGLLGGRVAEELVFGEPASGAADDLLRVTEIARQMVCQLGMSDAVGPLVYGNGAAATGSPGYSEKAVRTIDAEVRRLVDDAQALARSVLVSSRPALDRGARLLLEQETLSAGDLEELSPANGRGADARDQAVAGMVRPGS